VISSAFFEATDCLGQPRQRASGDRGKYAHPKNRSRRFRQTRQHQIFELAGAERTQQAEGSAMKAVTLDTYATVRGDTVHAEPEAVSHVKSEI
jgi:hypothetical protein